MIADGGWLKAHPLPSDKSSVGSFEILAEQNMRVIQDIMENPSSTPTFATSYDEEILKKLRGFYSSCTNEDRLDDIGMEPLLHFAKTVRRLYRGDDTDITSSSDDEGKKNGFTAALAFLHSRGQLILFLRLSSRPYIHSQASQHCLTSILMEMLGSTRIS